MNQQEMGSLPNLRVLEEMESDYDSYTEEESLDSEGSEFEMIEETNQDIRSFLTKLRNEGNNSLVNRNATKNVQEFLDTTISRAITIDIPLIPANTDLRYLLYEVTENHVRHFLVKMKKNVELITAQAVFELTAKGCDPDDATLDSLRRVYIPQKPSSMTIRDAFFYMIAKDIPLLLIEWNDDENKKYKRVQKVMYPRVVTLAQINAMISQRLVDDHLLRSPMTSFYEEDEEEEEGDSFQNETALRLEHHVVLESESESELEEDSDEEKKLREKMEFKKKCHDLYIRCKELLGKIVKHWVYRGMLTILVAIDILWSLFYILDYNNYVKTWFYLIVGVIMIVDLILRCWFFKKRVYVADGFELISLIVSTSMFFVAKFTTQVLSRTILAVIKTCLLLRVLRSYTFFQREKSYVSQTIRHWFNRNRSQKEEEHLDLSDISKQIIAMSWPGNLWESVWRNNIDDVERFLNSTHMGHYWVINLCAEGGYSKDMAKCFGGRNTRYCIEDHNTCSMDQVFAIVNQSDLWLRQDPANVIAIHCKGGKGRTGFICACLLLKQGLADSPAAALQLFATRRTSESALESEKAKIQCVSSPSQIRYVFYYNFLYTHEYKEPPILHLKRIEIPLNEGSSLSYEITITTHSFESRALMASPESYSRRIFTEESTELVSSETMRINERRGVAEWICIFDGGLEIQGDIKVTIQCTGAIRDQSYFIWFNTNFITRTDTLFLEEELDCSGTRSHPTVTPSITPSDTSLLSHNGSFSGPSLSHALQDLSEDETLKGHRGYGTFSSPRETAKSVGMLPFSSPSPPSQAHLPVEDPFYLRVRFGDSHLCHHRDPASGIVHTTQYMAERSSDFKKSLVSLGVKLKKTREFVVGGTQFLMNQTGRVGSSLMTYMNGEMSDGEEGNDRRGSDGNSSVRSVRGSEGSVRGAMKTKKRDVSVRSIPVVEGYSDDEKTFVVLKNMDE